MADKIGEG